MGQKTHPLGFRLGITQEHRSSWYADFKCYSILLEEDDKIRTYLSQLAKFASISNVYINRNGLGDQIELNIETGRPGLLVGDSGSKIKTLAANIKKFIPNNRQITINILEVENVNSNASLIADLVVQQLEDRVAFRRAIREALKCAQDNDVNGIKIEVSGRLNGAAVAANAKNNYNIDKKRLVISQIFADEGPKLKRIRPRAQGRAYKILKPTCHITVVVKPIS